MFERPRSPIGRTIYTLYPGHRSDFKHYFRPHLYLRLAGHAEDGRWCVAVATVIGQIVAFILALYFNLRKNHDVHFFLS